MEKTKDSPALIRRDLRDWTGRRSNAIIVELSKLVVTGVRNLENDPANDKLRANVWEAVVSLGAAVGRPVVAAE